MSNNPKIKYAKQRSGDIFYPRTVAEAIRFNDGESLETKFENGGLGGNVKNLPIATELEAREGVRNDVIMTPLRTLQLLEEHGGGGGGGGGITIPVITSEFNKTSIDTGTEISIPFTFYSPNLGKGTLHGLVDGVETINKPVSQGSSYADFGVLPKGSHRLSLFVVDRGGLYTDTISFNIRIGALDIASTFDDSNDFTITQVIKIPISIDTISVDPVYITYTIDGNSTRISASSNYEVIQLPVLSPGAHKVNITAESGVYVSNTLAYNVIIEDATNLTVISDFNITEITYRKLVEFAYRVSLKGVSQFIAQYYDNGELLKTLTIPSGTNIWTTRDLAVGAHELKIVVSTEDGSKSAELVRNITVIESDYKPLEYISDASLIAYFDATGKTNNDSDRDVWLDKSPSLEHPTVEFHNINYGTNGWIDDALRLNGGAYAVINLQPLKEITNAGITVDIKFRTRDVGHQDACVVDVRGSDANSKGFAIDTEKMYLNSATHKISSDVVQEEISRATFVIDKYNGVAKIFNNAVLTEAFLMLPQEDFNNTQNIYLGAKLELVDGKYVPNVFGDCEIYSIRVYARALESEEIVTNHIADKVDLIEQQESYELNYMNNMPTMYFYGDTSAMTKDYKVPLRIKYVSTDPDKYGESFDLVDCPVSWQGTSSLQYAVKNYKIRLRNQDGSKFKYSPYPDGIKEDTFCLKADYMESSHANNTGMAKFINDQLYDTLTPPQVNDPDVRTTINGFPIQLYIALNDSVEPTYIGIFNFNLDKSCNASLGLNNEVEGFENCVRFEVSSNSDTSAGAFRDDSDESLRADFEINYPDEDDLSSEQIDAHYEKLKRVVSWVKNCTAETFKAELEQYFNKEYLIKYFVQAHLFGMVDNLGKNMMIATWDGLIWYLMFYDMDTQLGLDNTGYLEFYSDIDVVEGVYNTSNSKLFVMLQECFADEIAETYKTLRRTGKYSMPTILSYWYGEQVSKIGELQYNKDMEAKYIAFKNDYLFMLHGRRYEHMKKWLTERMLYLDTIYGYEADTSASITIRANTLSTITFKILTYSPQYLKVKWRNGVEQVLRIGRDASGKMIPTTFSGTVATATDQEIIIYNAQQIKNIEGLASANPSVLNFVEASRLTEVVCRLSTALNDVRLSSKNKFLSKLDLGGSPNLGTASESSKVLDLSNLNNLEYIDVTGQSNGSSVTSIILPSGGCNIRRVYLPNTVNNVDLRNMPMLEEIGFGQTGGNNSFTRTAFTLSNLTIINCPKLKMSGFYSPLTNNESISLGGTYYTRIENSLVNDIESALSSEGNYKNFKNLIHIAGAHTSLSQTSTLIIKNVDFGDSDLIAIGMSVEKTEMCIDTFEIAKVKCRGIHLLRFGFKEETEIDLRSNTFSNFKLVDFANISNLYLPSGLTGLVIDEEVPTTMDGCPRTVKQNWWWFNNSLPNYNEITALDSKLKENFNVTIEGTSITEDDYWDLSSLKIVDFLVLRCASVAHIGYNINCDFTKGTITSFAKGDSGKARNPFILPITSYVEGVLKSTNDCRVWGTPSSTEYPPIENFDNLEWDLSEVTNLSRLFMDWRGLKKLPDSVTPELLSKANLIDRFLQDCKSLEDLGNLEGADLYIKTGNNSSINNVFNGVKGPFTLGNVTLFADKNYTVPSAMIFANSGLTSIGDVVLDEVLNPYGLFNNCSNLESIGNIDITAYNNDITTNYFLNCSKLKSIKSFNVTVASNVYIVKGIASMFENCTLLEDFSNINIPVNNLDMQKAFKGCGIKDITSLPNYYELIKRGTNLNNCFEGCSNLTTVPDLEFNASECKYVFTNCINLTNVGNIVVNSAGNVHEMFGNCSNLVSIEKLDIRNVMYATFIFNGCESLTNINYLDQSNMLTTTTQNIYIGSNCNNITHIIFHGSVDKYVTNAGYSTKDLDLDSVTSLINCLVVKDEVTTLALKASTFALLTEELIAIATEKNWSLTAMAT